MNSLWTLAVLPLVLAVLGLFPRVARWLPALAAALMVVQVGVVLRLAALAAPGAWSLEPGGDVGQGARLQAPGAGFGLDGLGAGFVLLTTVVAAAAFIQAAFLLPAERHDGQNVTDRRLALFYTLSALFLVSMYAVLLAQNLGYLWIAMEATTLMSAPLVYYHRSRESLEATWKYLLLCSVGIAFALFGTLLLVAASERPGDGGGTLTFADLLQRARGLDPRLLRLGFLFCLLGYGTKAGLFPLHNWLPDAHSEAPAPASALLSGALLNCALVALWRISAVVVAAGQTALVQQTLVPVAAVTVLAASLMLVRQHDLKRMWAYSSVEHVGLLSLAIGIGSGPLFLLHAVNHSLVKAALFLLAGNVLHLYGTKALGKLGGLLRVAPGWGALLAAASFAVAGSPPFGTFLSEWLLLTATITAGHIGAAIVVMVGLTLTFVALASHVGRVLFGPKPSGSVGATHALPLRPGWSVAPALLMAISLLAGIWLAPPVMAALNRLAPGRMAAGARRDGRRRSCLVPAGHRAPGTASGGS